MPTTFTLFLLRVGEQKNNVSNMGLRSCKTFAPLIRPDPSLAGSRDARTYMSNGTVPRGTVIPCILYVYIMYVLRMYTYIIQSRDEKSKVQEDGIEM